MSLNISLPSELEQRVRDHVASGLYGSASEVIREALRLFETYHALHDSKLTALQADINQGIMDVINHRIDHVDIEAIKKQGRRIRQAKKNQQ